MSRSVTVLLKILIKKEKERVMEKISYEHRANESVDDIGAYLSPCLKN